MTIAAALRPIRWGDNDRYFGPFTYAREPKYKRLALTLASGDDDEYPHCRILVAAFGHTLICRLPQIIKPWRRKVVASSWDSATIERMGRNWYYDTHERQYGFSYSEGFLQVFYGRQTHDSRTDQNWGKHLPWTQWRHTRHSLYDLAGREIWSEDTTKRRGIDSYKAYFAAKEVCPTATFAFKDFDGEALSATTLIEQREYKFGQGWFKWLSLFCRLKVHRSLDIAFSGETGKRKGSWKGGTLGHGIEMLPGELHEAAFRRYCDNHGMTFAGRA